MDDLKELGQWLDARGTPATLTPSSLPDPTFECDGRTMVSFSSNNYLGLAGHPRMKARAHAALEHYGVGNCESRLLGGNLDLYDLLEARLAGLKRKEAGLLFATGYLTNLGVLPALVRSTQLARLVGFAPSARWKHTFFTDEYNHLSIREGIRMSGAPSIAYRHADMDDLERKLGASPAQIKIIATDGVFSQHGDIVPLPDMLGVAERYDAFIYLDDAHGTGVLGRTGAGTSEHFDVASERIINMGTLSKAYGCIGGFIATERYVASILRMGCPAYGFTSTLPPDQAAAVLEALDIIADEPARRDRLWDNQRTLVQLLRDAGISPEATTTPILPIRIGDETTCLRVAAALAAEGIHVDPVTFPAIPVGDSRLRIIVNSEHTSDQMRALVDALALALSAASVS